MPPRVPVRRRRVLTVVLLGALLGVLVLGGGWLLSSADPCHNTVLRTVPSPDRSMQAVLFVRDCGATAGLGTHVSIVAAGQDLPGGAGSVFVADAQRGRAAQDADGAIAVQLRWTAADRLEVTHDAAARVFQAVARQGGVMVSYVPQDAGKGVFD